MQTIDQLRANLSKRAKNGIHFILAAGIVWALIALIWTLEYTAYQKSIYTFMLGVLMLPLAFIFSRLLKAHWKMTENPLAPLGMWLNFAQLFYFPFLVFILLYLPDYFVMVYVIITGAHLFPYAWFYNTLIYAVFAGVISVGALFAGLMLPPEEIFYIPLGMSLLLFVMFFMLFLNYKKQDRATTDLSMWNV